MTPQQAADSVVFEREDKLMSRFGRAGDLSVVCMNSKGEFGAATNIKTFSFVVATARQPSPFSVLNACGRKRTITR